MNKKKITMPKIIISSEHKKELATMYEVSKVAVQNALNYYSHSDQAKEIRKSAIVLLKKEVAKAAVTVN